MSALGLWALLLLLKHPGLSSVSVISGTGDSSLETPFSSEPQISSPSSLLYAEQGEAAGVHAADLRHLPGPQEDSWDEKWAAKLQAVNESLPFGLLLAHESSEQAGAG